MKFAFVIITVGGLYVHTAITQETGAGIPGSEKLIKKSKIVSIKDSLKAQLPFKKTDTGKVNLLNLLSLQYYSSSYDSAWMYASEARQLAEKINYPEGMANAILNQGVAEEIFNKNWDTAIICYRQSIAIAKLHKKYELLHQLYGVIHNAFVYQGNFPQAMGVARDGLELARARDNKVYMLHYTCLAAAAYFRQNIFDKALTEYQQAEKIASGLDNREQQLAIYSVALPDVWCGMGDVYTAMGDTARAIHYLNKSLAGFSQLRKNIFFYRHYMVSNVLFKIGLVYKLSGGLEKGLRYFLIALDSARFFAVNPYEKAAYCIEAGEVLRQMKNLPLAKKYLYEGLGISSEIKHAETLRDASHYLSLLFADENKYDSAWLYNRQYITLKDSITNVVSKFRTEEIRAVYDINEKNKVIVRQTNTRNILLASFAVLLITLGFLYNRYRLRQKNRYQQQLNKQQNELFNAIAAAQEQERKRIAQDIHDGLGSVLSAAKLKMAEVKEQKPEMITDEKFVTGISLIDEASAELRNISHNIMPATLSKLGLVPALKSLTEKISSDKGLQVQFIAHDFSGRLDEQTEISIYRILLELVNNVVKHAAATKAIVQLVKYPDSINITVEDNGRGFDKENKPDEKTGIGLGSVAARVEYLKGAMDIDSTPGKGTTIVVDIPVST